MMMNRRTLVSVLAACALSAGVAGGAAAMPDHVDGPVPQSVSPDEISLFEQRATTTPASPTVGAHEVALFKQRSHRTAVECDARSPGQKALDREYEAAGYVRIPAGTTAPAWFDALFTRSDELNEIYWLGAYAKLQN
jgi:hypothetical protein